MIYNVTIENVKTKEQHSFECYSKRRLFIGKEVLWKGPKEKKRERYKILNLKKAKKDDNNFIRNIRYYMIQKYVDNLLLSFGVKEKIWADTLNEDIEVRDKIY